MKRKISLIVLFALVAVACLGVLAACKGLDEFSLTVLTKGVENVASSDNGKTTYTLPTSVSYEDESGKTVTAN
ncbi:MAG: hypothetical protein K2M64_04245, partial [Clostridia bacterium]|nr:hypothetical protein [Clostridia bacterium]